MIVIIIRDVAKVYNMQTIVEVNMNYQLLRFWNIIWLQGISYAIWIHNIFSILFMCSESSFSRICGVVIYISDY